MGATDCKEVQSTNIQYYYMPAALAAATAAAIHLMHLSPKGNDLKVKWTSGGGSLTK